MWSLSDMFSCICIGCNMNYSTHIQRTLKCTLYTDCICFFCNLLSLWDGSRVVEPTLLVCAGHREIMLGPASLLVFCARIKGDSSFKMTRKALFNLCHHWNICFVINIAQVSGRGVFNFLEAQISFGNAEWQCNFVNTEKGSRKRRHYLGR